MQIPKTAQKPCYIILFSTAQSPNGPYEPYITLDAATNNENGVTAPHGLSKELTSCLKALWFCLHLPATVSDLLDLEAHNIRDFRDLDLAHEIVLLPSTFIDDAENVIQNRSPAVVPVLIFSPDSLIDAANQLVNRLGIPNRAIPFSEIAPHIIPQLWYEIHQALIPDRPYLKRDFEFVNRLDVAPILLPNAFLKRQFGNLTPPAPNNTDELATLRLSVLNDYAVVSAVARCEDAGMTENEAEKVLEEYVEEERHSVMFPVSIVTPGVAPAYIKKTLPNDKTRAAYISTAIDPTLEWTALDSFTDDVRIENTCINIIAAHRAIARGGTTVITSAVPDSLFHQLDYMEREYGVVERTKRKQVWRWLNKLGSSGIELFDDSSKITLNHASFLNIFSNFPVGLAVLPGDTSPLCCRVPIAYRPLIPLTRALQTELSNPPIVNWGRKISVLVVECIDANDLVGKISRATWADISSYYNDHPTIDVTYIEVDSPSEVASALSSHHPDAVVISAHGYYDRDSNTAGITIGSQRSLGDDLGKMPPLVVLSACHVAPRGAGVVSITDLLLRQGAFTVLGTLVPVDVRHNAILLNRLLLYIGEAQSSGIPHKNFAQVWHHVATSNAVHDIVFSNSKIAEWVLTEHQGKNILEVFTQDRSLGRLRKGHIYKDTTAILREIASETNTDKQFDTWLSTPGYIPETLFYVLIGWPERIRFDLNDHRLNLDSS